MFPRNLTVYRFGKLDCEDIEAALKGHVVRDPGPMELGTSGFASPYSRADDRLTVRCGKVVGFLYQARTRDIRPRAVNDEVANRVQKIADEEGRKVGARERKSIRDDVWNELLPRALVVTSNVFGWIDPVGGRVVIDTRSRRTAEAVLSNLRQALGSLPAVPPSPEESPRLILTHWLANGVLPEGIAFGDECELRDPATSAGSVARCRRQDLDSDEIREHLRSGKQCFATGLVFQDRMTLVLSEDLTVKSLRPTDVLLDGAAGANYESQDEEVEGSFTLAVHEVDRLLAFLEQTFRIPRPEAA